MTDQELLVAIANVVSNQIRPLEKRMESMENRMESMEKRMESLEKRMDSMEKRMDSIEKRTESLEKNMEMMNGEMQNLKKRIKPLEKNMKRTMLLIENDVLTRIGNIEDCYISAFYSYSACFDQVDPMKNEIQILKQVVSEHSDKFYYLFQKMKERKE